MLLHVSVTSTHQQVDISVQWTWHVQCLQYGSVVCHEQLSRNNTHWYKFISTLQNL